MLPPELFMGSPLKIGVGSLKVPLLSFLQASGFSLLLIYLLFFSRIGLGLAAKISIVVTLAGGVWGWLNAATDFKHWMFDMQTVYALTSGVLLVRSQPLFADNWSFIRKLLILSTSLAAFNLIGQIAGFLVVGNPTGRLTSGYLFTAISGMLFFLPLIIFMAFKIHSRRKDVFLFFSVNLVVLFGISLSATRSMLIVYGIAMLLMLPFLLRYTRQRSKVIVYFLIFTALILICIFSGRTTILTKRLEEFKNWEEDVTVLFRTNELENMFAEVSSRNAKIFGLGIGSTFYNPVHTYYSDFYLYSLAPHIAIFTPYLKFGIVGMVLFVVIPALWIIRTYVAFLFTSNVQANYHQRLMVACATCLLTYLIKTSMSGGWSALYLFMVGMTIGIIAKIRQSLRHYRSRNRF